jgi:hypothetical protein
MRPFQKFITSSDKGTCLPVPNVSLRLNLIKMLMIHLYTLPQDLKYTYDIYAVIKQQVLQVAKTCMKDVPM